MSVLFHLTAPAPKMDSTDAVYQEAELLRQQAGGDIINLYPLKSPNSFFPWFFFGLHKTGFLRQIEQNHDLHHVFGTHLYPFPYLFFISKPLVYSVTTILKPQLALMAREWIKTLHTIVISHERDQAFLESCGIRNYRLIRPGIDTSKFTYTPQPDQNEFILLVGSAPWTRQQFHLKGIDHLLEAAKKIPRLKLVFLWRGTFLNELEQRIIRNGLVSRTEIINYKADVNKILAEVHAAIVLSQRPSLVKAHPHSLMESLCAGKPVALSGCLPMAEYVAQKKCGVVVHQLEVGNIMDSIQNLIIYYSEYQKNALSLGKKDFDIERYVHDFVDLYRQITGKNTE